MIVFQRTCRSTFKLFNDAQFLRKQSIQLSHGRLFHIQHRQLSADTSLKVNSPSKVNLYRNLFNWKNEIELAKVLASNVVFSHNGLVVLNKPWGVSIHSELKLNDSNKSKNKNYIEQMLNSKTFGESRYSVSEITDYLAQLLNISKLNILKSLHRNWSGLILLTTRNDLEKPLAKSIRRAKSSLTPYMKFYCITNGIIQGGINKEFTVERCGIRLDELDEFGELKEPVYVPPKQMSNLIRKNGTQNRFTIPVKPAVVQYRTLAINPKLSVSLVELHTTVTKWSLIQCFLAYKAAFVLGDNFFSHRVRHILGQPVVLPVKKTQKLNSRRNLDQKFEPLSMEVRRTLNVNHNSEIPLMIHHYGLVLPKMATNLYQNQRERKNKCIDGDDQSQPIININENNDLIITVNQMPLHFIQTLDRLELNIFC